MKLLLVLLGVSFISVHVGAAPQNGGAASQACRCKEPKSASCPSGSKPEQCKCWCENPDKDSGNSSPPQTTQAPSDDNKKPEDDGKKGKKGGGKCFSADDTVTTEHGVMKMSELVSRKDIKVMTQGADGQLEFSPVQYWIHAKVEDSASFVQLSTESGQKLDISDLHLIYKSDCTGNTRSTVFAKNVAEGECVFVRDSINNEFVESKVVDVSTEVKRGIYAPITANGNIVVNDVLASCFTNFENEQVQKMMFSFVLRIKDAVDTLMPSSLTQLVYSTPFEKVVEIPEIVLSFINLQKFFSN